MKKVKVTGELYDLYFLLKRDEAETSALMAEKTYFMSQAEIDERYRPTLELQEREQRNLWRAICSEYKLDPRFTYILTRDGEPVPVDMRPQGALAV